MALAPGGAVLAALAVYEALLGEIRKTVDLTQWIPVITYVAGLLTTAIGAGLTALFAYLRERRQEEREDRRRREEWDREDRKREEENRRQEELQRNQDRVRAYKDFIANTTFSIPLGGQSKQDQLNKLTASFMDLQINPLPSGTTKDAAKRLYETPSACLDVERIVVETDDMGEHIIYGVQFGPLARDALRVSRAVAVDPPHRQRLDADRFDDPAAAQDLDLLEEKLAHARTMFLQATRNQIEGVPPRTVRISPNV